MAQSEAEESDDRTTMRAVALLFHGRYSDRLYTLAEAAMGGLAVEDVAGPVRFVVRRVPGKRCVFVATHDDKDGLNIEQLDFTKFDGRHQIREACSPKESPFRGFGCSAALHFNSEKGYCQYGFSSNRGMIDLADIPFPDGTCRSFAIGGREKKQLYAKFVDAFEYVYRQCKPYAERRP
jgi:hypothetical protein